MERDDAERIARPGVDGEIQQPISTLLTLSKRSENQFELQSLVVALKTYSAITTLPMLPLEPEEYHQSGPMNIKCIRSAYLLDKRPHLRQCHPLHACFVVVMPSSGFGSGGGGLISPIVWDRKGRG